MFAYAFSLQSGSTGSVAVVSPFVVRLPLATLTLSRPKYVPSSPSPSSRSILTLSLSIRSQGKSYFASASDSAKAEWERTKSSLSSTVDDVKSEGKAWLSWGESKVDQARSEVNRAAYKTEAEYEKAKQAAKDEVRSLFSLSSSSLRY